MAFLSFRLREAQGWPTRHMWTMTLVSLLYFPRTSPPVSAPGMRALREKKRGRDTECDKIQQLAPDWWLYSFFSLFTRRLSPRPPSKLPGDTLVLIIDRIWNFLGVLLSSFDLSSNLMTIKLIEGLSNYNFENILKLSENMCLTAK